VGGKWADRSPKYNTFLSILAWGGFSVSLVPYISRPILRFAANAFDHLAIGNLIGSFIVVMIMFLIPITLLGTASPFAIRLAIKDSSTAGSISGKIYAISTLGSFVGTFIPDLFLIPLIGTFRTFLLIGATLVVFSLIALTMKVDWRKSLSFIWMPAVIILLWFYGSPGFDKDSQGLIFETESSYNYIQVLEENGFRLLRLNEGQGIHSMYHPDQNNYYGPWEQVLVAPFFNQPPVYLEEVKSMAIVGLAAGTTARQAFLVYPDINIDGFEIDSKIVEAGYQFFDMANPRLNVFVQDGRWGLATSQSMYDIISVDAYRPPYIPWHLTTVEFFQEVFDHLNQGGVMVINIGRGLDDRRLINALGSTILQVFPTVHVMDLPDSFNSILFATKTPTDPDNLKRNFEIVSAQDVNRLLLSTMERTIYNLKSPPETTLVFTDDKAPIEWYTNAMIIEFFLEGKSESLQ
jgi:spermidine synthase